MNNIKKLRAMIGKCFNSNAIHRLQIDSAFRGKSNNCLNPKFCKSFFNYFTSFQYLCFIDN